MLENFKLVKRINVAPLMAEVNAKFALFGVDTSRQQKVPEQRETETIYLRSAVKPYPPGVEGRDVHESRRTKMYSEFPVITAWLEFVREGDRRRSRAGDNRETQAAGACLSAF